MTIFCERHEAFGAPGIEPRWTYANKQGIGTAYSTSSRIWFTLWDGIITEVYYPTLDKPQIRDLQYLISDGHSFAHEEKCASDASVTKIYDHALAYEIVNSDPKGRYTLTKEVITDPHLSCVLQHTRLEGKPDVLSELDLYVLCAPHLDVGGWGNNAQIIEVMGKKILLAEKNGTWMAIAATIPFTHASCGYVGESDGWTDLSSNYKLDWEFDQAKDGNIALIGKLDLAQGTEFTLGLAFGDGSHNAISTLFQSLSIPFKEQKEKFQEQWKRSWDHLLPLCKIAGDDGSLYYNSYNLLLAHEDKTYPGALIASTAIPWGEAKTDDEQGGYHLVWTRDMVSSTVGLMAAGHYQTALRSLIYLATTQQEDGGFAQNFWLNGEPYWTGIQLDEVAFPIILARKLEEEKALSDFDIYPLVLGAASYLIKKGPATQQERWEENNGYSPSTLAACIGALICAACIMREHGDDETARYVEEYADFLESHIERWTVTTEGTLVEGIKEHYIRVTPAEIDEAHPNEDPNNVNVPVYITSFPPDEDNDFKAKEIVDCGFLQLVRYGIRKADDPIVVNSVKVIDQVLKTDTPNGPMWHRYNHDHYGQKANGEPYKEFGIGRGWPLLTGERGHYELALGNDVKPYIEAMEKLSAYTGLIPEQSWDEEDCPEKHMYLGRPTGSAMPLLWAHSEYIKLLRSVNDDRVYDLIPEVAERYLGDRKNCKCMEVWKFNRQIQKMKASCTLRIQGIKPFKLNWTKDNWSSKETISSHCTVLQIHYVDLDFSNNQSESIEFTFFWAESNQWEGSNYQVEIEKIEKD